MGEGRDAGVRKPEDSTKALGRALNEHVQQQWRQFKREQRSNLLQQLPSRVETSFGTFQASPGAISFGSLFGLVDGQISRTDRTISGLAKTPFGDIKVEQKPGVVAFDLSETAFGPVELHISQADGTSVNVPGMLGLQQSPNKFSLELPKTPVGPLYFEQSPTQGARLSLPDTTFGSLDVQSRKDGFLFNLVDASTGASVTAGKSPKTKIFLSLTDPASGTLLNLERNPFGVSELKIQSADTGALHLMRTASGAFKIREWPVAGVARVLETMGLPNLAQPLTFTGNSPDGQRSYELKVSPDTSTISINVTHLGGMPLFLHADNSDSRAKLFTNPHLSRVSFTAQTELWNTKIGVTQDPFQGRRLMLRRELQDGGFFTLGANQTSVDVRLGSFFPGPMRRASPWKVDVYGQFNLRNVNGKPKYDFGLKFHPNSIGNGP